MNPNQTDSDDEMENDEIVLLFRRVLTKETPSTELDNAILESFRREFSKPEVKLVNRDLPPQ